MGLHLYEESNSRRPKLVWSHTGPHQFGRAFLGWLHSFYDGYIPMGIFHQDSRQGMGTDWPCELQPV